MYTIQNIRKQTKLSRAEFARYYEIPLRTLEDWESGRSTPPNYVAKLLINTVIQEFALNNGEENEMA